MSLAARLRRAESQVAGLAPRRTFVRPPLHFADWCPTYLPHYFPGPPADFHAELFDRLDRLHERRGSRDAVIAPRNASKSTIETLAYPLRVALEGWERHVVILSDSSAQACDLLGHLRRELEDNPLLADAYPESAGRGPVWRDNRIQLRNGTVVEALGRGGRIRGRRNRQARPSLVILDDVQGNKDVTSATYRRRAMDWLTREVIPAGDESTNYLSVGSAIHPEAVAVGVGKLPGWDARTYRAVHRWPTRLDLWAELEVLATNLADPDRKATAERFYLEHRGAMDDGAATYWPSKWPLFKLMMLRAEIGAESFDSEYQGVPNLGGLAEWPAEWWDDRPDKPFWFDSWPETLVCKVVAVDPSKGEPGAGDYQAVAQVAMDSRGTFWCDCDLRREPAGDMVTRAIGTAREWGPVYALAAEVNGTLGLLAAEFKAQMGGDKIRTLQVTNTEKKELRILTDLGPYLSRGRLRVRRTRGGQTLADQGRQFPHSDFDDALDAVSMGVRTIGELYKGTKR